MKFVSYKAEIVTDRDAWNQMVFSMESNDLVQSYCVPSNSLPSSPPQQEETSSLSNCAGIAAASQDGALLLWCAL